MKNPSNEICFIYRAENDYDIKFSRTKSPFLVGNHCWIGTSGHKNSKFKYFALTNGFKFERQLV